MIRPVPDMTAARRSALDRMGAAGPAAPSVRPLSDIRVRLHDHFSGRAPATIPDSLVRAVSDRLVRTAGARDGPGVAVVVGVSDYFDSSGGRRFNEALFRRVWPDFQWHCGEADPEAEYRIKVTVTADGAIPFERYGSEWSFKRLHQDRDALLFSHLYGPLSGFAGGELLVVDARTYLQRHRLRVDDAFVWSDEPTAGSKPVLRAEHHDTAMAECGVNLGALGPDCILLVNNTPAGGILHGVTEVIVGNPDEFVREFHRCSVKEVRHDHSVGPA